MLNSIKSTDRVLQTFMMVHILQRLKQKSLLLGQRCFKNSPTKEQSIRSRDLRPVPLQSLLQPIHFSKHKLRLLQIKDHQTNSSSPPKLDDLQQHYLEQQQEFEVKASKNSNSKSCLLSSSAGWTSQKFSCSDR